MTWTDLDEQYAFQNGWAVFNYEGRIPVIMKIDDILGYREDNPILNGVKNRRHFKSDNSATEFVRQRAKGGNKTCKKALKMCPRQEDYLDGRI